MIKKMTSLSMAESIEYMKDKEVKAFVKSFVKLTSEKAKELKKQLEELDLIKLNDKQICKIIDFLPKTKEEVLKIVIGSNLDENEITTILSTIKNFK